MIFYTSQRVSGHHIQSAKEFPFPDTSSYRPELITLQHHMRVRSQIFKQHNIETTISHTVRAFVVAMREGINSVFQSYES